ncbi:class I poly(R)-hydroxyalkanoic acid synthase [Alkalilimnicola ehrlichii]|uniref:Class I poly(R)-hydroxyalkanoic acid synthase n=1 Tax=Alkalilimnicola ehrlichii TaxID=351052 RepID=A0A3E0X115_9GAMM|nr:class I poly(R)-hydroxyalkanoic acid synthase [Alkalilimnicola ehrlichii]RFA31382.1 class I poly(R)-hydroxyalkanoic acid synthase [Alkalilimnicola ehrlichii]RFA39343.1 class I poly(R)-hydroxyalkanoic acid synthase [Alkalilimnicola ehrlichii]
MSENVAVDTKTVESSELSQTLAEIASKSQQLVQDFLKREQNAHHISVHDALHMSQLFQQLSARMMSNPMALMQAQMTFWQDYLALVQNATLRMLGVRPEPVIAPKKGDKRFQHESWEENPVFDFIKQSYLLAAEYLHSTVKNIEGLDPKRARQVEFYTRAFVDAMAPSNFIHTNPEVLRATLETRGQNLLNGLKNLLDDLSRGSVKMTDLDAFEVGKNVAISPGEVIYQNDLIQLIQYTPSTDKVYKRPLLFIPPWINKFYIADLQPENSLVKYIVDQGFTLFMISWKVPKKEDAERGYEDYMTDGVFKAMEVVLAETGEKDLNAIGYCLGGTLLGSVLAYMSAKGDDRIKSAAYFTTLLDFSDPGDVEVFIDELQVKSLEERMNRTGYLDGRNIAVTFNMLRANDLIWQYFINNYLHGKEPFPFDLLYWNSDATNMPAKMHSFYLRNMYLRNALREPGGITLLGEPIDLRKIKIPTCFVSTKEDHIAPWKTTYEGVNLHSGPTKFILGGSGHIAGVMNPPAKKKYFYWTNDGGRKIADPDKWLEKAEKYPGSWWPEWSKWAADKSGTQVAARKPGANKFKPIEPAPGSYVKERIV